MSNGERWWFTFGCGVNDVYGGCYIIIEGTYIESRQKMNTRFGPKWCGQYPSAEDAGVEKYNLRKIL